MGRSKRCGWRDDCLGVRTEHKREKWSSQELEGDVERFWGGLAQSDPSFRAKRSRLLAPKRHTLFRSSRRSVADRSLGRDRKGCQRRCDRRRRHLVLFFWTVCDAIVGVVVVVFVCGVKLVCKGWWSFLLGKADVLTMSDMSQAWGGGALGGQEEANEDPRTG